MTLQPSAKRQDKRIKMTGHQSSRGFGEVLGNEGDGGGIV